MDEMLRRIGGTPLLRRTVEAIEPDRAVVLLFRVHLQNALEYYGGKYGNLPEFRVLDLDDASPSCTDNTVCAIRPAAKTYEYLHKECCVYAPPCPGPWGSAGNGWQQTVLAAHGLGLHSLLCERHCMEKFPSFGQSHLPVAYFAEHIKFFSEMYDIFADEESKATFAAVVRARLTGDTGYIPVAPYPQYYHPHARPQCGDVVCDAGGGSGHIETDLTGVQFARTVGPKGKVFCFEPIAENHASLREHTARCPNITLERLGVWSRAAVMPMTTWGNVGRIDRWEGEHGRQMCSFIDIDAYFSANHERCDFLKMDIEGAELEALKGAEKTLRRLRPKLAISVYHSPLSDFLNIPKFILDLDLGYEFFLGHHLPYWYETILYCKPKAQ